MSEDRRKKQREDEKPKHQIIAKVEHAFAGIKTQMKQSSTRLLRNHLNFTITCIVANLKLFAHKQIKLQKVKKRVNAMIFHDKIRFEMKNYGKYFKN